MKFFQNSVQVACADPDLEDEKRRENPHPEGSLVLPEDYQLIFVSSSF